MQPQDQPTDRELDELLDGIAQDLADIDRELLLPMTREELEAQLGWGSIPGFECVAKSTCNQGRRPDLYLATADQEEGTEQALVSLPALAAGRHHEEFLQCVLTWVPEDLRPAVRLSFKLSCGDADTARSQVLLNLEALRGEG